MAETPDRDSKTEEATERRTQQAIEQGNVPFSREAAKFASLLGMLAMAALLAAGIATPLTLALRRFIEQPGEWPLENAADAISLFSAIGWQTAALLAPVIGIIAALGMAASFLQNPPRLVFDRIQPDLSRISIGAGWRRLFGVQGFVEFLKSFLRMLAVFAITWMLFKNAQNDIFNAMFTDPAALPRLLFSLTLRLVAAVAVAAAVLAAADLVWSHIFWKQELRMTKQEVKEEHKQLEGDPLVKARLRSLQRDRARRRMIAAVPKATLVIANPTHYAVALRYVRNENAAPLVVAKGKDLIALKIREIAAQHSIPVYEDKPLARSLYEAVEVDKLIPPEFYKAVAQIIYFLFYARGAKA